MTALGVDASGRGADLADLADLPADALLDLASRSVVSRRAEEVHDLLIVGAWAETHATDPRRDGGRRVWAEDRLVRLGGEGTPGVQEFSIPELAAAREVGVDACSRDLADVLDLQYRLPRVWTRTLELVCPPWLSRKVARLSRNLPLDRVGVVDLAVAEALDGEAPGRVLEICAAKVIEADPATHAERVKAERRRRFVGFSRTDESGLRHLIARVAAGDAVWLDGMVDRVADVLAERYPEQHGDSGRDELRSVALGMLARPAEVLRLLLEGQGASTEVSQATALPADLLGALATADTETLRPRVMLYLHLSDLAVAGHTAPVARVEQVGALLADQTLFAGCQVTVKPVIDLNDRIDLNCYEHPVWLRERRLLATPGDTVPYAVAVPGQAGRVDLDHPDPYEPTGPPGQTGMHNSAPLTRRHHRWKTHAGYQSRQCGTSRWVWRTPHERYYLVDHTGTHRLDPVQGRMLFDAPPGLELYFTDLTFAAA